MLRSAVSIAILALVIDPAMGVTKQGCAAEGGFVEPSARGVNWWRCCVKIPSNMLQGGKSKIYIVCNGDSPQSNCDQIPYAGKEEKKSTERPANQSEKRSSNS